ncbi:MAG TPA: adenylate kinase [Candidatus Pullichristensenella excrementigallinarum]|uniref:Adenylate kinase n=1 Tax=Candidatus Pullichristensenella excrementigallinarum TaxID=2840907 RepID=A0A9D1IEQ9_9FIRM|nr:adenylate kinase [Candidatus Pullichristensenella excrementigallinarum]
MKLIFLGPPGAGKGTQALGVSSKLAVPHISTGDMLRAAVRNQTATGLAAKAYMDKGQLVPDEVLIDMVRERLSMDDCAAGYLLDGFPRTVEQAEALEQISAPDMVVNISVPDVKLLERLAGRRVCGKCQGTFHISKLADEEVCPVCKGELIHREDDKPETITRRLKVYHEQTAPLIGYYSAKGKLKTVDGDNRPEDVLKNILASLE